jgi:hypothetical protein
MIPQRLFWDRSGGVEILESDGIAFVELEEDCHLEGVGHEDELLTEVVGSEFASLHVP